MQISKARRQKLRPRFESINMRTEQALVQIHKYKYTNINTNAQMQIHKYKYTNKNTNSQIKRMVRPCFHSINMYLQVQQQQSCTNTLQIQTTNTFAIDSCVNRYKKTLGLIMQIQRKCNFQTLCLDDVCRSRQHYDRKCLAKVFVLYKCILVCSRNLMKSYKENCICNFLPVYRYLMQRIKSR